MFSGDFLVTQTSSLIPLFSLDIPNPLRGGN